MFVFSQHPIALINKFRISHLIDKISISSQENAAQRWFLLTKTVIIEPPSGE
jgi:hypothetical protein